MDATPSLPYVSFVANLCGVLMNLWTVFVFSKLLCRQMMLWTNSMMRLFSAASVTWGACGLVHQLYQVLFWRYKPSYNSYALLFTGVVQMVVLVLLQLSTLLLCIERCFMVQHPNLHLRWPTYIFPAFCILTAVVVNGFILATDFIPTFPQSATTECRTLGCLTKFSKTFSYVSTRCILGVLNVVVVVLFYVLLRRQVHSDFKKRRYNRLVLLTMLVTIATDCLPHLIAIFIARVFHFDPGNYVGPWSMFLSSLDAACCAFLYSSFDRRVVVVVVPPLGTTTTTQNRSFSRFGSSSAEY